ncbi:M12 family metallopeptidase [Pseudomonas sp. ZS1P83]
MNGSIICRTINPSDPQRSYQAAITECPRNAVKIDSTVQSVSLHSKLWKNFSTLSVCFLDKLSNEDKNEFKKHIWKWAKLTNLNIVFVDNVTATIRIKTDTSDNMSAIGTDARLAGADEPTMHIAEKPGSKLFQAVVLHEFGHALGLHHEHLHPEANIPWNKPKVHEHYAALGWSRADIATNLFDSISHHALLMSDYDKTSIMHYQIDKNLTDGKFEVGQNTMLSENDMAMAFNAYPLDGTS